MTAHPSSHLWSTPGLRLTFELLTMLTLDQLSSKMDGFCGGGPGDCDGEGSACWELSRDCSGIEAPPRKMAQVKTVILLFT